MRSGTGVCARRLRRAAWSCRASLRRGRGPERPARRCDPAAERRAAPGILRSAVSSRPVRSWSASSVPVRRISGGMRYGIRWARRAPPPVGFSNEPDRKGLWRVGGGSRRWSPGFPPVITQGWARRARPFGTPPARPASTSRICPHFVSITARCRSRIRNPAGFLASWPHPQDQKGRLSSWRNRIDSTPRPRLGLHVLVSEFRCFPGARRPRHRLTDMNGSGPTPQVRFERARLERKPNHYWASVRSYAEADRRAIYSPCSGFHPERRRADHRVHRPDLGSLWPALLATRVKHPSLGQGVTLLPQRLDHSLKVPVNSGQSHTGRPPSRTRHLFPE